MSESPNFQVFVPKLLRTFKSHFSIRRHGPKYRISSYVSYNWCIPSHNPDFMKPLSHWMVAFLEVVLHSTRQFIWQLWHNKGRLIAWVFVLEAFGACEWNKGEDKILYVAEKKQPKIVSFFEEGGVHVRLSLSLSGYLGTRMKCTQ